MRNLKSLPVWKTEKHRIYEPELIPAENFLNRIRSIQLLLIADALRTVNHICLCCGQWVGKCMQKKGRMYDYKVLFI